MDKYSGCNIVESVVTPAQKPKAEYRRKKSGHFFARIVVAVCAVGVILALHYAPIPALSGVRSVLHDVFCYDIFGRTEFGTSVFWG